MAPHLSNQTIRALAMVLSCLQKIATPATKRLFLLLLIFRAFSIGRPETLRVGHWVWYSLRRIKRQPRGRNGLSRWCAILLEIRLPIGWTSSWFSWLIMELWRPQIHFTWTPNLAMEGAISLPVLLVQQEILHEISTWFLSPGIKFPTSCCKRLWDAP